MTMREKIEQEGNKLERDRVTFNGVDNCFMEGANFAIKAVIQMLMAERAELEGKFKIEIPSPYKRALGAKISNMDWIINQLKS